MESRKYRNHPIVILQPFIIFFLFFGKFFYKEIERSYEKGIYRDIKKGFENGTFFNSISKHYLISFLIIVGIILIFIFVFLLSFYKYKNTYIEIDGNVIRSVKNGLFFRNKRESSIIDVSSVNIKSNIFYNFLNIRKVVVDINSSEDSDHSNYEIILSLKKAEELKISLSTIRKRLAVYSEYGMLDEANPSNSTEINRIYSNNNASSNEDTYNKSDSYSNVDTYNKSDVYSNEDIRKKYGDLKEGSTEESSENAFDISPITIEFKFKNVIRHCLFTNLFSIMFTIFWLIMLIIFSKVFIIVALFTSGLNFFKEFNKISNFKVTRDKKHLYIKSGLFYHNEYEIDVNKIISISLKSSFISKYFGYYLPEINVMGVGNSGEEINYIGPYQKKEEVEELLKKLLPEKVDSSFAYDVDDEFEGENIDGNGDANESTYNNTGNSSRTASQTIDRNSELSSDHGYYKKPESILYYFIIKNAIILYLVSIPFYMAINIIYIFIAPIILSILFSFFIFYGRNIKLNSKSIVVKKGIINESLSRHEFSNIESMSIEQDIIQGRLGIAKVVISYKDHKIGKFTEGLGVCSINDCEEVFESWRKYMKSV